MEQVDIAVIGGGPAGLRAAEVAAAAGRKVAVFEGKPGVGRKFLVAGKGGLNLTHSENIESFINRYSGSGDWEKFIKSFQPGELREWAHSLGQETFQASSGRVYPKSLKGAPLLRAWLGRLRELGVEVRTKHLWKRLLPGRVLEFADGSQIAANAVIFALGGGSWPKTGSDGGWIAEFERLGIASNPLQASNCGWECNWESRFLEIAEGMPIKNISVRAGGQPILGELLVTKYGLEGGTIYALGRELRSMQNPSLSIDFKPTFSHAQLVEKLGSITGNLLKTASNRWKLSKPAAAILAGRKWTTADELTTAVKNCVIPLTQPRPIAEAISSAGGVCWSEIDENLMLKAHPNVFVCGEMIDWDAPTGGYLLQGAFATGTCAGNAASVSNR